MNNVLIRIADAFAPYGDAIRAALLQTGIDDSSGDGSHDWSHLVRVWKLVKQISAHETAVDLEMLAIATLLHDCVQIEKSDPRRALASQLSADKARDVLKAIGWDTARIEATAHVIEAHSFSANIAPRSLEARILRDADRLDAIGAIGIARTFYVAGRMGSRLYDFDDPLARERRPDDTTFALDHFDVKLLKLADGMSTEGAQRIAQKRAAIMRQFVQDLADEITA